MSKMENQLEKILPIVTGNQDVSKEVKYLKKSCITLSTK
jgi:hypothetical protein